MTMTKQFFKASGAQSSVRRSWETEATRSPARNCRAGSERRRGPDPTIPEPVSEAEVAEKWATDRDQRRKT
jgi:hypothetical protein